MKTKSIVRERVQRLAGITTYEKDLSDLMGELEAFAEARGYAKVTIILADAIAAFLAMSDRERAEIPSVWERNGERNARRRRQRASPVAC